MIMVKYLSMNLSSKLKKYLKKKGASEVGFADITNFTPKPGLNSGVIFYITYPKEIIRNMQNAPTHEYLEELIKRDWELILVSSIPLNCPTKQ